MSQQPKLLSVPPTQRIIRCSYCHLPLRKAICAGETAYACGRCYFGNRTAGHGTDVLCAVPVGTPTEDTELEAAR